MDNPCQTINNIIANSDSVVVTNPNPLERVELAHHLVECEECEKRANQFLDELFLSEDDDLVHGELRGETLIINLCLMASNFSFSGILRQSRFCQLVGQLGSSPLAFSSAVKKLPKRRKADFVDHLRECESCKDTIKKVMKTVISSVKAKCAKEQWSGSARAISDLWTSLGPDLSRQVPIKFPGV